MKTFFTSDLHFGCENLRKATRSEYATIEEHDAAILDGINRTVDRRDRLILLGDLCLKKPGRYRQHIRCRHIVYLLGNHCKEAQIRAVFGGQVYQQKIIKGEYERFFCNHYPVSYWDRCHYSVPAVYGHLHDNLEKEAIMDKAFPGRRSMDVGVDAAKRLLGGHRPFSEAEVLSRIGDRLGHEELWRDIPGYEGAYQASYHGRIRSLPRLKDNRRGTFMTKGLIMSSNTLDKDRYSKVALYRDGVSSQQRVSRLVALTWLGPCPSGSEVCHGSKGNYDDSVPNLRYGTHQENMLAIKCSAITV
jgi:calcineurin-like phosphoesterase family protein